MSPLNLLMEFAYYWNVEIVKCANRTFVSSYVIVLEWEGGEVLLSLTKSIGPVLFNLCKVNDNIYQPQRKYLTRELLLLRQSDVKTP